MYMMKNLKLIQKYYSVGILTTLMDLGLFEIIVNYQDTTVSKFFSTIAAIVFGFYLNLKYTFNIRLINTSLTIRYLFIQAGNLYINVTIIHLLDSFDLINFLKWAIAVIISSLITFLLMQRYLNNA